MSPTTAVREQDQEPGGASAPAVLLEELVKLLVKAVRAHQLYLQNNPVYQSAIDKLRAAFAPVWTHTGEIVLTCTESEIRSADRVLLEEPTKSSDSLPWLFYKDGVRELRFEPGFEHEELLAFLEVVQRARRATPEDDDLLTMLWERDFVYLRYRFVDLALESAPSIGGAPPPERRASDAQPAELGSSTAAREGVVSLEDFDATLYFLDEREIEYLRAGVQREYAADLRASVLAMLFDIFEQQTTPATRDEICEILDSYILHLLSAGQFRAVAYLLRESAVCATRARDLAPQQRTRLSALPERLSAPEALSQMLQVLDEVADLPPQGELTELFEQLRPAALGTVFAWSGRLQNPKLRPLLESAATRLAGQNTGELVRLIEATDRTVMLEAIRHAAALRSPAAVAPLGKVLAAGDRTARLAAVQALVVIGSPGALQLLEKAVEDSDRDVRLHTARAIAAKSHRPALPRLEAVVRGKRVRETDLTEKMAFFEAYGAICGDDGVSFLDELLNGKGFLGRREEPELRACAAMALGRIGSERALECLRRALGEAEKEVLVRNAVNKALKETA